MYAWHLYTNYSLVIEIITVWPKKCSHACCIRQKLSHSLYTFIHQIWSYLLYLINVEVISVWRKFQHYVRHIAAVSLIDTNCVATNFYHMKLYRVHLPCKGGYRHHSYSYNKHWFLKQMRIQLTYNRRHEGTHLITNVEFKSILPSQVKRRLIHEITCWEYERK